MYETNGSNPILNLKSTVCSAYIQLHLWLCSLF